MWCNIDNNNLVGPIPSSLTKLTNLNQLLLHGNDIADSSIQDAFCEGEAIRSEVSFLDTLEADCGGPATSSTSDCSCCTKCWES